MSQLDYYKILQVTQNATASEIKAAYRRLAKIYHPDKNTEHANEEKFKLIKEAYETLINPQRRARYDAKRGRATTFSKTSTQQKTQRKDYSFTKEEAQRRQYYQQHYKTTQTKSARPPEPAKQQNELKYILISVPVAVALLLLMIRMYEKPSPESLIAPHLIVHRDSLARGSDVPTPESPFRAIFPRGSRDSNSLSVIKVMNRSGFDAVIFLENDSGRITRHHFIGNKYQLYLEYLRPASYKMYYWLGKNFSYGHFLYDTILGNFKTTVDFDSLPHRLQVSGKKNDTVDISLADRKHSDTLLLKKLFRRRR